MNQSRHSRIPRLWIFTATLILGLTILALGSVYAMRALPHPGCILVSNSFTLDLLSGRTQRFFSTNYSYVGTSPDLKHQIEMIRTHADTNEHTIYLRYSDPLQRQPIQTGVLPNNRSGTPNFVWSSDSSRVAYLWQNMSGQYYLSLVNGDGSNQQTISFPNLSDEGLEVTRAYIFGWSPDNDYLVTGASYSEDGQQGDFFTFWALPDLHPISTPLNDLPLLNAAWSQSGHRFAAVTRDSNTHTTFLHLFTPEEGAVTPIAIPYQTVNRIAWSPDDRYVALASLQTISPTSRNWSYDIYSADGEPLFLGLPGENTLNENVGITMVRAMWTQDSRSWVYLQERGSVSQPKVDLIALDVETGLHRVIAPHLVRAFLGDMFFIDPLNPGRNLSRPPSAVIAPNGQRILIPHWEHGKIKMELADIDGNNRLTLVEAADGLTMGERSYLNSNWWAWQGRYISVVWATYDGSTRAAYLTTANSDGSSVYMSDEYTEIIDARRASNEHWVGFLGKRRDEWGLELFDAKIGKLYHLLGDLDPANGWQILGIPNRDAVFVLLQPTKNEVARSQLYYVPLDGGEARKINDYAASYPVWSPDRGWIAVLMERSSGDGLLELVDMDDMHSSQMAVPDQIGSNPWLGAWNYCE